ncbi:MAG: NAD(P)H-binding protein [Planctomycetes bacterium]|nr:NAD(P)H-binding protein [Planctomycetota bacterium]
MPETVLVVGARGMLGEPVARRLAADGHTVRVMSRSRERVAARFGAGFDAVGGDVEDLDALRTAMRGCTAVHLNLSGGADWDLERRGAEAASRVAAELGVRRLTVISGASTCEENAWFPGTRAKLEAERAIAGSGAPFTVFRCTMFMELLPKLVRGGRAMILGDQPTPWHWVAADDFAAMVSRALGTAEAAGRTLYVHGPEALTFEEAMRIYQPICAPGAKVTTVPFWLLRLMSWMPGRAELRHVGLPIMRYFTKVREIGDAAEANALLGAAATTLRAWSAARAGTGA